MPAGKANKLLASFLGAFFLMFLIGSELGAQHLHPKDYFNPPLKGKLKVVGTFGELRPNHFHSGIDFSTGGKIGLPVYACADGYVRRIRVSPYGYGRALYVKHPNGYETVYGHLSAFRSDMDSLVEKLQNENEVYELQEFPTPGEYLVKKGEIIGYSGNTGRSYGPHLHFEVRLSHQDRPINPELFAFGIEDGIAPTISSLMYIQPIKCSEKGQARTIPLIYVKKNHYRANIGALKLVSGGSFALKCYDKQLSASNSNGVYEVRMLAIGESDTTLVYHLRMDELDFASGKCVNGTLQWDLKQAGKGTYYSISKLEGNTAPIFALRLPEQNSSTVSKGFLIEIGDASGNISKISILNSLENEVFAQDDCIGQLVEQGEARAITCGKYSLHFNENTLFEDLWMTCSESEKNGFAALSIGNQLTALAHPLKLSFELDSTLLDFKSKLIIAHQYGSSRRVALCEIQGDTLTASLNFLADTWLEIDTFPPKIVYRRTDYDSGRKYLAYYAKDDASDLAYYKSYLNSKWIPSEYKSIQEEIRIYLPDKLKEPSLLKLEVRDELGNESIISKTIKPY